MEKKLILNDSPPLDPPMLMYSITKKLYYLCRTKEKEMWHVKHECTVPVAQGTGSFPLIIPDYLIVTQTKNNDS